MNQYGFKTVAMTGVTGTLGIALINECINNGIRVIAFAREGSLNLSRIPDNQLVCVKYCALESLKDFDPGDLQADVFIHLAWGHTNRSVRNELRPQIDNIVYSLDSVKLAALLGCRVYVGAGSQAEYGRVSGIINEDIVTKPETAYGMAKLCSSQMTRLECKKLGIKHIWPRIFSTYGPYTQDSTIINYSISCLLKGESPSLTACDQIWDFLYVDDAARALLLLADKGIDGEIYCVASGKVRTMKEYIELLHKNVNGSVPVGYGDIPYEENTVMHLEADISKLQRDTGFTPIIDFESGIIKTVDWAKDYYK